MSETKFTPGPWYVKKCGSQDEGEACRISTDPHSHDSYEGIAFDGSYNECHHVMTEVNARLIAAAPDLYASVKALADFIDPDMSPPRIDKRELLNKARAALAKVDG
jgi:hypothetical protein